MQVIKARNIIKNAKNFEEFIQNYNPKIKFFKL